MSRNDNDRAFYSIKKNFQQKKNFSPNSEFQVNVRVQAGIESYFNNIVKRNKIHEVQS